MKACLYIFTLMKKVVASVALSSKVTVVHQGRAHHTHRSTLNDNAKMQRAFSIDIE